MAFLRGCPLFRKFFGRTHCKILLEIWFTLIILAATLWLQFKHSIFTGSSFTIFVPPANANIVKISENYQIYNKHNLHPRAIFKITITFICLKSKGGSPFLSSSLNKVSWLCIAAIMSRVQPELLTAHKSDAYSWLTCRIPYRVSLCGLLGQT